MGILTMVENPIARFFEFSCWIGKNLEPVDLIPRILRLVEENKRKLIDRDKWYAPNLIIIEISEHDYAKWQSLTEEMEKQFQKLLEGYIQDHGYLLSSKPLSVRIFSQASIRRGTLKLRACATSMQTQSDIQVLSKVHTISLEGDPFPIPIPLKKPASWQDAYLLADKELFDLLQDSLVRMKSDDWESIKQSMETLIPLAPTHPGFRILYHLARFKLSDSGAVETLKSLTLAFPEDPLCAMMSALISIESGTESDAFWEIIQGLDRCYNLPLLHLTLAYIYYAMGFRTLSFEQSQIAGRLNPKDRKTRDFARFFISSGSDRPIDRISHSIGFRLQHIDPGDGDESLSNNVLIESCQPQIRIGRKGQGSVVDLEIDDPSVSAIHARILRSSGKYFIEDLGSANKTRVNHAVQSFCELHDRDRITMGKTHLVFKFLKEVD